ncbi:hypothetical protein [Halohasta litorea]|uniref:DUF4397 domain-containing protein n=1 Tax=Halohasta litorea TaxID=869891 RepID=A0ABD6D5F9_9EURY|nr:hypothetical protein [Halohasta litorea]
MKRRTYLGLAATGVVGSVAGCTSAADGNEYPPYPDSETVELSGDGVGTSDRFEISLAGPTLVDVEHMGSDNFTVVLADPDAMDDSETGTANESTDETNSSEAPSGNESGVSAANETDGADVGESVVSSVVTAVGPYDGRSLLPVAAGSYVLRVVEADAEWTATVYDLPVYEDGVGTSLPIEREGEQYDVIGPIDFGEQADTEFSFSVTGEGLHRVFVTDREGGESLTVFSVNGEADERLSQEVGGVGYIEVLSFGSWTFELS